MNQRGRRRAKGAASPRKSAAERLMRMLVAGCSSPAEVLELYYWSREPGLLEIIRGIATMSEDTRARIEAFIALASNSKSVRAEVDGRGVLTLTSAEAARTVALARCAAQDDGENTSRLIH